MMAGRKMIGHVNYWQEAKEPGGSQLHYAAFNQFGGIPCEKLNGRVDQGNFAPGPSYTTVRETLASYYVSEHII